jgi:hypothetical protein
VGCFSDGLYQIGLTDQQLRSGVVQCRGCGGAEHPEILPRSNNDIGTMGCTELALGLSGLTALQSLDLGYSPLRHWQTQKGRGGERQGQRLWIRRPLPRRRSKENDSDEVGASDAPVALIFGL